MRGQELVLPHLLQLPEVENCRTTDKSRVMDERKKANSEKATVTIPGAVGRTSVPLPGYLHRVQIIIALMNEYLSLIPHHDAVKGNVGHLAPDPVDGAKISCSNLGLLGEGLLEVTRGLQEEWSPGDGGETEQRKLVKQEKQEHHLARFVGRRVERSTRGRVLPGRKRYQLGFQELG